jgi:hypothetical protein
MEGQLLQPWQSQELHDTLIQIAETDQDMCLFKSLQPTLLQDGNQWICLLGENLQIGIAGFGDSPMLAVRHFNQEFYKPIKP